MVDSLGKDNAVTTLRLVLNVIVSAAALIAGLLWWKSATVKVRHRPGLSAMTIGDTDVIETARLNLDGVRGQQSLQRWPQVYRP